jgi:hypothetical protein
MKLAAWLCIVSLLATPVAPAYAIDGTASIANTIGQHVDADAVVHYTTGINPMDYPCARASIIALYQQRDAISDLSRFHPKRVFTWVMDVSIYYMGRLVDFLKRVMNPDAVMSGVRKVQAMASVGNPLATIDRNVQGWAKQLSPRSQFVLKRKVYDLIHDTTNDDGSCKPD